MSFKSIEFVIFLICVVVLYWQLKKRQQNYFLLVASYFFYGWWSWRFLSLLILTSVIDYTVGRFLEFTVGQRKRRWLVTISVVSNLTVLSFFKYFNFFVTNIIDLLHMFGFTGNWQTLHIILPLGISFYTFQNLSYIFDVYRKKIPVHHDILEYFSFVSFFPLLVAGPIERGKNLLPQFSNDRKFDINTFKDGMRQILWGFFKKIVIADGLAIYVNDVFGKASTASGAQLLLAIYFFAFQLYCDFSGYSDIALGSARLLGFKLMRNFAYPYFSRNISEFWQRWHISLSSWLRDYLYFPLYIALAKRMKHPPSSLTLLITFFTFGVSGLWHGAAWTFVTFGLLNGFYYAPEFVWKRIRPNQKLTPNATLRDWLPMIITFHLWAFSLLMFRANSFHHVGEILTGILTRFHVSEFVRATPLLKVFIIGLLVFEWIQRGKAHPLMIEKAPKALRWSAYYAVCALILFLGTFNYVPFIYFQF